MNNYHSNAANFLTALIRAGSACVVTDASGIRIQTQTSDFRINPEGYLIRDYKDAFGRISMRQRMDASGNWQPVKPLLELECKDLEAALERTGYLEVRVAEILYVKPLPNGIAKYGVRFGLDGSMSPGDDKGPLLVTEKEGAFTAEFSS